MSFEQAARWVNPAFAKLALVYASGFKGSAARLRNPDTVSLYFSHKGELGGDRADYFSSWLFAKNIAIPVWFWGDLDWSGMRILAAMPNSFPRCRRGSLATVPCSKVCWTAMGTPLKRQTRGGNGRLRRWAAPPRTVSYCLR